jgi:hypothetical protein
MNEESQLPSVATLEIFSQNDNEIHLAYNLNEAIIISNLEVINNLIIHGSEQIIFIKSDAHIIDIVLDHVRLDPNSQLNIDHITIIDHKINYPLPKANKHLELIAKIDPNSIVFSKLLLEQVKGVNLIPGSGEFVYDTLLQNETKGDLNLPINYHQHNSSDAVLSIKQLKEQYKQIKWIAIIVSWFGNSTDTEKCLIYPAVEALDEDNCFKPNWCVAGIARDQAWLVSKDYNGNPNYGGTPDDVGLIRYLDFLRQEGFKILFYPMIFLDVPNKPWRGHLTGTYQSVDTFFTKNSGYNHFILHYANLVKDKVDGFIIGSELTGLTKVSDELGNYPAVQQFIKLAGKVKNILGAEIIITYAADWSEYHHANDGMRPLDELWASDFIDVVGIDAYFPITNALRSNIDANLIFNGWTEGEGYQYYYDGNRNKHQLSNDWAWKDLAHWWQSEHYDSKGQKTKWQPKQKKIWFTEFGFPSIDKATNQPNTFFNPECIDGGVPKFSDGSVDYDIQKKALVASLMLIADLPFIENSFVWCFDARAYPTFPLGNIWSDNHLWPYGHWLNGKHDLFSSGNIRLIEDLKVPNLTVVCNNLFIDKSIEAQDLIYLEANLVFKNDILRFIHGFKIDLTIPINISSKKLIIKSSGDIDFNEFILQSEEQIKIEANKITLGKNQHLFKLSKRTIKLPKLQLIKTDNLSIKCSALTIHPINFEVSDLLLIEATAGAVFLYHKYTQQKQVKHGSKTTIRTSEDFINNTSIKGVTGVGYTEAAFIRKHIPQGSSLKEVHVDKHGVKITHK